MNTSSVSKSSVMLSFAVILLVGGMLRGWRLNSPIDGYHSMNEAWYAATAENYRHTGLLNPVTVMNIRDVKARPLFGWAAYACGRIFGCSPMSARLPSVLFSIAICLLLFVAGTRLRGNETGLWAAAMWAVCPIAVIVGRNAQPDAMYVGLILICFVLYDFAVERNSLRLRIAAGVVWAAAMMTKNLAIAALPAVIAWELLDKRAEKKIRGILCFLLPALILSAPLFIYHYLRYSTTFMSTYAGAATAFPHASIIYYMLSEMNWSMTPLLFVMGVVGLLLYRNISFRNPGPMLFAIAFIGVYLLQHVHSYYFLGAVPFLVLAAAGLTGWIRKPFGAIAGGGALAFALAFTLVMLLVMKPSHSRFLEMKSDLGGIQGGTIIASDALMSNYGPVIAYTLKGFDVMSSKTAAEKAKEGARIPLKQPIFLINFTNKLERESPYVKVYIDTMSMLRAGNHVLGILPLNLHSFIPRRLIFDPVDGPPRYGIAEMSRAPFLRMVIIPRGWAVYRHGDSVEILNKP